MDLGVAEIDLCLMEQGAHLLHGGLRAQDVRLVANDGGLGIGDGLFHHRPWGLAIELGVAL